MDPEPKLEAERTGNSSVVYRALYVGKLHPDVTEVTLWQTFSSTGQIVSIKLCRDMMTREFLGYAYINFSRPADGK